ncbi:SDR family oxidoreductase [Methyloversatilis thermotolerans]|uniref:SDR family oxidoreductase n=1 Tax=Methyloversatilis thermotolerans TaxID=1346290 RepID=UPI000363BE9E|nr:SDR family oxidoreductase [Methyloversatilis thermotolerans]
MDIGNWRAVVTGHSSGLGLALAHALLDRGMTVLGISRRRLNGSVRAGLQQQSLDLSDTGALRKWLDGPALREFLASGDRVLLINNAGTLGPVGAPGTQSGEAIARAIALNVTAPLMLTDAVLAASAQAAERRIAHVSSGAAGTPYAGWSIYCASKAALDQHARATALDAPARCRISSVAPGVVDTDMQARIRACDPADFPQRIRFDALKRDGQLWTPDACAQRFVAHLLSTHFGNAAVVDLRRLDEAG